MTFKGRFSIIQHVYAFCVLLCSFISFISYFCFVFVPLFSAIILICWILHHSCLFCSFAHILLCSFLLLFYPSPFLFCSTLIPFHFLLLIFSPVFVLLHVLCSVLSYGMPCTMYVLVINTILSCPELSCTGYAAWLLVSDVLFCLNVYSECLLYLNVSDVMY